MISRRHPGLAVAVLASLATVAGAVAAQEDESPLVTGERILPARQGAVLWARNPGPDTVWVDSVHVSSCVNVLRKGCGSIEVGIVLAPGEERELLRLAPAVPEEAFGYRWSAGWRMKDPEAPGRVRRAPQPAVRTRR